MPQHHTTSQGRKLRRGLGVQRTCQHSYPHAAVQHNRTAAAHGLTRHSSGPLSLCSSVQCSVVQCSAIKGPYLAHWLCCKTIRITISCAATPKAQDTVVAAQHACPRALAKSGSSLAGSKLAACGLSALTDSGRTVRCCGASNHSALRPSHLPCPLRLPCVPLHSTPPCVPVPSRRCSALTSCCFAQRAGGSAGGRASGRARRRGERQR